MKIGSTSRDDVTSRQTIDLPRLDRPHCRGMPGKLCFLGKVVLYTRTPESKPHLSRGPGISRGPVYRWQHAHEATLTRTHRFFSTNISLSSVRQVLLLIYATSECTTTHGNWPIMWRQLNNTLSHRVTLLEKWEKYTHCLIVWTGPCSSHLLLNFFPFCFPFPTNLHLVTILIHQFLPDSPISISSFPLILSSSVSLWFSPSAHHIPFISNSPLRRF